ncbi:MAG: class I SAM-dependent methyltransferase [Candidatus Aminicenantes bacterium]
MNNGYWDQRGRLSYTYKGEIFYTITPLPYYLKRRELLLKKLNLLINSMDSKPGSQIKIADFGSGDGYYCCWLAKKFAESNIYGYDISESMIKKARKRADSQSISNVRFICDDIAHEKLKFDVILIMMVFQHFRADNAVKRKISRMKELLKRDGKIILFEATARRKVKIDEMIRRPERFYMDIFQDHHFKLVEKEYISFPFFLKYQNTFLKTWKKVLKGTEAEKCIRINKNMFLKTLNEFVFFLGSFADKFMSEGKEGYTLFVFEK